MRSIPSNTETRALAGNPKHWQRPTPMRGLIVVGLFLVAAQVIVRFVDYEMPEPIRGQEFLDYVRANDWAGKILIDDVLPEAAGVLLVFGATWRWGWHRLVFHESDGMRLDQRKLYRVALVALACAFALMLAHTPWELWSVPEVAALVGAYALVGFLEESVFRGYLLVGLRARFREVWVWLITTSLFAGVHGIDLFSGRSVDGRPTWVAGVFVMGTLFYMLRRWSGMLLLPIAVHALWDFCLTLNMGWPGGAMGETWPGVTTGDGRAAWLLALVLAIVGAFRAFRPRRRKQVEQAA